MPPATIAAAAAEPVDTRKRRRSQPSGARDGPGVSMLGCDGWISQMSSGMPTAAPSTDGNAAPMDSPGRCHAASAPINPNAAIPITPTSLWRAAKKPTISAAIPRTAMIPTRSARLSLVPNQSIANVLSHGGMRSMNSLPTASMGETTSMMPATSMPMVTATAPATSPASVANSRGVGVGVDCGLEDSVDDTADVSVMLVFSKNRETSVCTLRTLEGCVYGR